VRTNQAILDEAARSVRRTFLGSVAGTLGMLAVVGAAGAYGMPERLTARSLKVALSTWNDSVTPMIARAAPMVGRATVLASNMAQHQPATMPAAEATLALPPPSLVPPPLADAPPRDTAAAGAPDFGPVVTASVPRFSLASLSSEPVIMPERRPAAPAGSLEIPDLAESRQPSDAPMTLARPGPAEVATPVEPPSASAASSDEVRNSLAVPKIVRVQLPRPKAQLSPAQRLDLHGKQYEKAERCLAQAVYFEARNQSMRGQMAVAQVVMNRVFSPHYPNDVCSVVYQNANRRLACQFTFACDGHPETVRERGAWARAQRIARETLDAKIWLADVGKATHYHAAYVHPYWIRDMKVMVRYGLHTFYRPRLWGDGSNEPSWGAVAHKSDRSS
jgi:spore germination cell wall hydrolase CwlJ-like protein